MGFFFLSFLPFATVFSQVFPENVLVSKVSDCLFRILHPQVTIFMSPFFIPDQEGCALESSMTLPVTLPEVWRVIQIYTLVPRLTRRADVMNNVLVDFLMFEIFWEAELVGSRISQNC